MNEPSLIFLFLHTARALQDRLDAAFAAIGLSAARFGVLDQLARAGEPLSLGDIASGQSCVRSNVTQLIDRMAAEGLVLRVADPSDRRGVRAALTPLGQTRQQEGHALLASLNAGFNDSLSKDEQAALHGILAVLDTPPSLIH